LLFGSSLGKGDFSVKYPERTRTLLTGTQKKEEG